MGARQLVVQEALETMRCSGLSVVVVDAHDDDGVDLVLGRHGQDDLPGAGRQVLVQGGPVAEHARGLDDEVHAQLPPRDLGRIAVGGHGDPLLVHVHRVRLDSNRPLEAAHDRVVLAAGRPAARCSKRSLIATTSMSFARSLEDAEHAAPDAAEAVDADAQGHHATSLRAMPSSSRSAGSDRRPGARSPSRCRTRPGSWRPARPAPSWPANRRCWSRGCARCRWTTIGSSS